MNTIKVVPFKRGRKKPKAKKKKRVDIWAPYGLKRPQYTRYSGLQGVLWYVLSRKIRQEEFEKYGGECVDGCGRKVLDWREADCGHFLSSTKINTRFIRENLGLQTKFCNSPFMGNDNTYGYGKTINERYGAGTAERLIELSRQPGRPLTKTELHERILKELESGKPIEK